MIPELAVAVKLADGDRVAMEVEQQVRGHGRPVGNVRSLIGDTGT